MESSDFSFKTRHYVAMLPADEADFSTALRAAFPNIKFLPSEYYMRWDGEGRTFFRKSSELDLTYLESLNAPQYSQLLAWLEPDGWTPIWYERVVDRPLMDSSLQEQNSFHLLRNEPRLQFRFDRSVIRRDLYPIRSYKGSWAPRQERTRLEAGRIWSRFRKDDREHRAFLDRVWRLLGKLTTNRLVYYSMETREPYPSDSPEKNCPVWAGYHAIAWCNADPDRYIDDFRPPNAN